MAQTGKVVINTGRGLWPLIKLITKVGLVTIIFFFVIVGSLQESYQEKSIKPLVTELGQRFFIVTYDLYNAGLDILENYETPGFFNKLQLLSSFSFDIYIAYRWLALLKWISQTAITGDNSRVTTNWIIGLLAFFSLQYIFILAGSLFGYLPTESEANIFKIPVLAFFNIIKVAPTVLSPIVNIGEKFNL